MEDDTALPLHPFAVRFPLCSSGTFLDLLSTGPDHESPSRPVQRQQQLFEYPDKGSDVVLVVLPNLRSERVKVARNQVGQITNCPASVSSQGVGRVLFRSTGYSAVFHKLQKACSLLRLRIS